MSLYQHGLGAAFLAKRATEIQHRRYAILKVSGAFGEAPENVLQSLHYPDFLLESSFGDLLRFMLSTSEGDEALKEEAKRALSNHVINSSDERRDERERSAGRARYTSRRRLLMEHLENDGDRVWAARTRAALSVWLS